MATKAHLEGNKRYLETQDDIKIRVPSGKREQLKEHAADKGHKGIQPYILDLLRKDGFEI